MAAVAGACAPQVAVLRERRTVDPPVHFTVVDARPPDAKQTKFLSLLIFSCDYSVRQLGDELTDPNRIDLLKHDLVMRLGPHLEGKTLSVSRYAIYFNNAGAMRASNGGGVQGGAVGAVVAAGLLSIGDKCPREKMTAGWFAASEVTTPYSPLIIEIDATMDGMSHSVRTVYSTPQEFAGAFGEPEAARTLFRAMRAATADLVQSLRSGGRPAPPPAPAPPPSQAVESSDSVGSP